MGKEQVITETIYNQVMEIRREGKYNMFSIKEIQREACEKNFYELVILLEEHPKEYAEFIMRGKR